MCDSVGLLQKALILIVISLAAVRWAVAEPIHVKYVEGTVHGFMVLRTEDGKTIAIGGVDQTVHGALVTTTLNFHFEDGSEYEETTVFSQRSVFRVLSNHLLAKGPAFKKPTEVWIDCRSGQVKVREIHDRKKNDDKENADKEEKVTTHHIDIPADLANGIAPTLIKNFSDDSQRTLTMLAAAPKPRIVKLVVTLQGEDSFSIEGTKYKAKQFLAKVQIGGVAGAVAPVVGQQPPDSHFWILEGEAPTFLKSTGPLAPAMQVWQIELASPVWSREQK
jgi:hypothetical protein